MTARAITQPAMRTISLEELNEQGSLLTRKDRKYIVPLEVASEIASRDDLLVLEIDGLQTFRYESVYFDTPGRVSYLAAARKRRRRFKVRTRTYVDSGTCSLEVKTRERRGMTEKHRISYPLRCRRRLSTEGMEFINGFAGVAAESDRLQPALTTSYERTTLFDPASRSRVTIDRNLRCATPDGMSVGLIGHAVIETKTAGPPCPIDRQLWDGHNRPVKISKFCTGLAALTPGLPANKWNRVLRTHFGWQPRRAHDQRTTQ